MEKRLLQTPPELDVVEGVGDHLVIAFRHGNGDGLLQGRFADVEALSGGADLGVEVDHDGVVNLVAYHAGVLISDESELGGDKRGKQIIEGGEYVGAERLWIPGMSSLAIKEDGVVGSDGTEKTVQF